MSESDSDSYQDRGDSNSSDTGSIDGYEDQIPSEPDEDSNRDSEQDETEFGQAEDEGFRVLEDKRVLQKLKEEQQLQPVPKDQRCTLDCISKYEYSRVIGMRARQIASNCPLYIDDSMEQLKGLSAIQIAEREFRAKRIPYIIRRVLPGGKYEDWALSELENKNI